ncbi:MAG TPA: glycosyltransferase family 2 protein [Vicinamibacterales bacterium]|jgi:N-acetylglucosaminyl-diphospho-decaprenol L-rhamnosyltransferase|nr:glycosyltransferase family 2 protein [Vicinamibacterales bacterium]
MTRLAIIIVSYNTRQDLEACLASLRRNPPVISSEVVVVDNASSDGSADAARAGGARVLEMGRNAGFSAANNAGIRASSGDLVLLLNSDTIVPAGAVDRLVERLEATGATVAGPRIVDGAGRAEISFGRMITPLNELRQKRLMRDYEAGRGAVVARVEAASRREQLVDWVTGACLLVRRAEAEAAGLFDERFFLYTEDVDFCAAIRKRGGRVLFTPSAEITHLRGRSRASNPAAANDAYTRSHVAFYEKHYPLWTPFLRLYLSLQQVRGGRRPPSGERPTVR